MERLSSNNSTVKYKTSRKDIELINQWEIMCGGISDKHKIDIIEKVTRNQELDRQILDINFKIDSIICELDLTKQKDEAKKDKKLYNEKLNLLETLLNSKNMLVRNKDETL